MMLSLLVRRSWPATAVGRLTPTATTYGASSSGRPTTRYRCWTRRAPTSSCTEPGWSNAAWPHRPSTGGSRRSAGSTDSLTSTGGSGRTRPSTSAAHRSTPRTPGAWTAPSSVCSSSRQSSTTTTTRRLPCSWGSTVYGSARRAPPTSRILASNEATAPCASSARATGPPPSRSCPAPRTIDLAVGERYEGPILRRRDGERLDRRTAHRWVRAIGKRAGLGAVHPHMLRAAFIMAALDAGVPLRDVQTAARHADPRTTTIYDRRR
jgi:Phage integrase family